MKETKEDKEMEASTGEEGQAKVSTGLIQETAVMRSKPQDDTRRNRTYSHWLR